jgi:hypothetical protein
MVDTSWASNFLRLTIDRSYFGSIGLPVNAWPHDQGLAVPLWDNDTVETNQDVNYAQLTVMGREGSFYVYQSTANMQVDLTCHFVAGDPDDTGNADDNEAPRRVVEKVQWLVDLKRPMVHGNLSYPPPPVYVSIGSLITFRALATSVQPRWMAPWQPTARLPMGADVACQFTMLHEVE